MILVVEGLTDAAFFQELLLRLFIQGGKPQFDDRPGRRNIPIAATGSRPDGNLIEVEFRNQEGKAAIPDVIRVLLAEGMGQVVVAQDIDHGSPVDLSESTRQLVDTIIVGQTVGIITGDRTALAQENSVRVIPMGLHQNPRLEALGISKHEMEDYLIELALEDPGLRQNVPDLQTLLSQILPTIREHEGPFNSSKEVFQLIKPIVQHGFSDVGVVQKMIRDADEGILRSVLAPLLSDVEVALGL